MEIEFIAHKVYYKIFDLNYTGSSARYSKYKSNDAVILAEIDKNITNIKNDYKISDLSILNQVHGINISEITNDQNNRDIEADGSITTQKNIALGILTADCVPVLLASDDGNIIGAAHCGWKSAYNNIIEKITRKMQKTSNGKIKAIIGPSIQQKSYEIGQEYYQFFISKNKEYREYFIPSPRGSGYFLFDLPSFIARKLMDENIEILYHIKDDTYEMEHKYPSYRRFCHKKQTYNQNILSTIIIK